MNSEPKEELNTPGPEQHVQVQKYERLAREKCLLKVRRDSEQSAAMIHRADNDVQYAFKLGSG